MSVQVNDIFEILPELPKSFAASQCIFLKHELLLCGGYETNDCYSYHTRMMQYKYVCSYPNDIKFDGHCVIQLNHSQTNPNEIYFVWEIDNELRARGLIGGINNDLLLIAYHPQNIEAIDLKTMKSLNGIKNNTIPRENTYLDFNIIVLCHLQGMMKN
ncbi:hypothetical protein RFI_06423 [Reticulomyxa filosa]|uniref:Uncharacterized protein n=1 Tax=Reticulomyxa filosa TaxID=46433 RepID=X6NXT9_RETFI|nr:hypothetical protein RFI_06423 [Reticulomyxa filosa]|eukprot:ETO30698.1 hypothetical protein RFI_06423 [Reticulomyxa filosa]